MIRARRLTCTLTFTCDLLLVTCAAGEPLVTSRNVGSLRSMAVLTGAPLSGEAANAHERAARQQEI